MSAPVELAQLRGGHESACSRLSEPLVNSGSLSAYEQNDITTSIGREIPDLKVKEVLAHENSDNLIRDLAITGEPAALLCSCQALTWHYPSVRTWRCLFEKSRCHD